MTTEEDEEVDYENDVVYEPELEGLLGDLRNLVHRMQINLRAEDEDDEEMGGWDFDAPPPPGAVRPVVPHHHHHHHVAPRGFGEMFGMLGGHEGYRGNERRYHIFTQLADASRSNFPEPSQQPRRSS